MNYVLAIDIKVSGDGTKLWIIDETIGYGEAGNSAVTDITKVNVTFLKQNPVTLDYSDVILEDYAMSVPGTFNYQSDMVFEITPEQVGLATFSEGIYHIKYSIEVDTGNLPNGNDQFYYTEVMFPTITSYYNKLLLKIAKEMTNDKLDTSYLTGYTMLFGTKLDALKECINIGNTPFIRKAMAYLLNLMTKYPNYNGFSRYYKSPFRT